MEVMESYLDFAEDDYAFLKSAYDDGLVYNAMASIAQNICEKYLKHIVDKYVEPEDQTEMSEKASVLRTHNLRALINYLQGNGFEFDRDTKNSILKANGFYYSARYPGPDSFFVNQDDIDDSFEAVEKCREKVLEIVNELERGEHENEIDHEE